MTNSRKLTKQEQLMLLHKIKNKVNCSYNKCCFENNSCQEFNNMYEIKTLLDALANDMIEEANAIKIIVLEDILIRPGETVEVLTNISNILIDENKEINFEGYLPEYYLSVINDGSKIKISNKIPREVFKKTDDYYGVYQILKGTTIGILYNKKKIKTR